MSTRWGIIGTGKICHDFVCSLTSLPSDDHSVVAVAARSLESSTKFVEDHDLPKAKAYGSYEELVKDPNVEVVYIGSINPQHVHLIKLALNHGKHTLCEKPLTMNLKETKQVVELAKSKKLFLMEGLWSRCFPVYTRLRELLKSNAIGEVLQVVATFGTLLSHKDRCRVKELGGGACLDIGIYCVQLASFVYEGQRPLKVVAAGHLNDDGVDESSSATLIYANGKTATLIVHGGLRMESEAIIIGTKGAIKVPMRFWCPTELVTPEGTEKFDLPPTDKTFNCANSVGLSYEAAEVRRCLLLGLTECPVASLDESLVLAEIVESIRKQVGVTYPQDLD